MQLVTYLQTRSSYPYNLQVLNMSQFIRAIPRNCKTLQSHRWFSTAISSHEDIRERLQSAVKAAMRNKDTATSTTLRSILSEVYARDKGSDGKVTPPVILEIMRKATTRRADAAVEFQRASRPDLAEKERKEAAILSEFLPPLLTEAQIDEIIRSILKEHPLGTSDPRKHLGQIYKAFYSQVEKFQVDPHLVKERAQVLVTSQNIS